MKVKDETEAQKPNPKPNYWMGKIKVPKWSGQKFDNWKN